MLGVWGCIWTRLMTCLILSQSFPCHNPLSIPICQVKTKWTGGRIIREECLDPLVPKTILHRKCILPCASGFYQREGFCLWIVIFFKVGKRQNKSWINQKEGSVIIEESQDSHCRSFIHISTCIVLHKQYPRHNSKITHLWHWNAMLLFSLTNIYWEHTTY